jgi:hypothetical protein
MKYLGLLILFFSIISCCSKKHADNKSSITSFVCPNKGDCILEIIKNKGITLKKTNDIDVAYEIVEDSTKMVVKYNYSVNQDQAIYDGGYAEEIIFEINAKDYNETLIDKELINAKIFYRRFCACRGKTGLVLISKGKLEVTNLEGKINLNLDFDCGDVPQIIKNIKVVDGKL